ncbi:Uncharacterized protein FWK35_00028884, partial [Aphis craccivora]
MFADDTSILSTRNSQLTATDNLQKSIDNIFAWTRRWKIKINGDKSVHVNYTLRKTENIQLVLNQTPIPQIGSAKYLGMHLDSRLNWKHHVRQKKIQIEEKMRKLYWLVGPFSELTIENKTKSNIDVIQRCQNIALRTITAEYQFERNNAIHRDMMLPTIADEIQRFARKHETRLDHRVNPLAIQLLDNSKDFRRLKRRIETHLSNEPNKFWGFVRKNRSQTSIPKSVNLNSVISTCDISSIYASKLVDTNLQFLKIPFFDLPNNCDFSPNDFLLKLVALKNVSFCGPDGLPGDFLYKIRQAGRPFQVTNYRPISVLSHIPKIFESLVLSSIQNSVNPILANEQHGFRPGGSTSTCNLTFCNYTLNVFREGKQVDAIYTDFVKTFDSVNYELLIAVLKAYGFGDPLLSWFNYFLINRAQWDGLNNFVAWSESLGLFLNISKCRYYMTFTRRRIPISFSYSINGTNLSPIVTRPIVEYGSIFWDPQTPEACKQLERVLRKFLSFVKFNFETTCEPHDYTPVIRFLHLSTLI